MNQIELKLLGGLIQYRRESPASYKEVTGKQFIHFMAYANGIVNSRRFLARFYRIPFLCMLLLDDYLVLKLGEGLEFMSEFKVAQDGFFMERIPGTILVAPSDQLSEVSFLQYMYIDKVFTDYIKTEDPELLYTLTAAIYKPKDIPFPILDMDENLHRVKKYALPVFCQAVFINFVMVRTWLSTVYSFMFPMGEENASKAPSTKTANWLDVFDAFVGDNIPDTEYYKGMSCMDAFRIINKRIKEHKHGTSRL